MRGYFMTVRAKTVVALLLQTSDRHTNMQAKHTSKLSIFLTATLPWQHFGTDT